MQSVPEPFHRESTAVSRSNRRRAAPAWETKTSPRNSVAFAAAGALLVAIAIYFRSFCEFFEWDDEGYVLVGIRSMVNGHALYDQAHAIYGPFFYLFQYVLHKLLHVPVTNDVVRWTTGTFWLCCVLLCAWIVGRQTRSWLLAALAGRLAMKFLVIFTHSAGHPQELCMTLMLVTLALLIELPERHKPLLSYLLGAAVGGLLMTKINIGTFALLAVALVASRITLSRLSGAVYTLAGAAAIALPFAIMRPLLQFPWALRETEYVALSIAAAVLTGYRSTSRELSVRFWIRPALSLLGVVVFSSVFFLPLGTTLNAMLHSTILGNGANIRNWYIQFPVPTVLIPAGSLVLAVLWLTATEVSPRRLLLLRGANFLKGLVALLWFVQLYRVDIGALFTLLLPFCWLAMVPSTATPPHLFAKQRFGRFAISIVAVLNGIYPLPVAGADNRFSTVLMVPVLCCFIYDVAPILFTWKTAERRKRLLQWGAAAGLAASYGAYLLISVKEYRTLTPLNLPGAERIHVNPELAGEYQWIVRQLKSSCDSHFSMPGFFSLYFWTRTEPPTLALMSNWLGMFSAAEQQRIVEDISRIPRMCIVYNPRYVEYWRRGQSLSASPLARYIGENFTSITSRGEYSILVRKPQAQDGSNSHGQEH